MDSHLRERIATRYPQFNSVLLVQEESTLLFNSRMNIKQIRHAHFMLTLNEQFGGKLEAMAAATNSNPKHLSQIKNATRNIGDRLSAKLEKALGLPPGSWDVAPSTTGSQDPVELKERELLRLFRESGQAEQDMFLRMMRGARQATGDSDTEDS